MNDFLTSERKGKKYKVLVNDKYVHFGAEGYRAAPGTPRGDRYCARSYGILDGDGDPTRTDRESPNYWARKLWKCQGKKSQK